MKRIVAFYKNGDRYLKEMGSGNSSLYFFLFFFVLHSMREHIIQFIGFWPSFIFVPHTCPKSYAWRRTY